MNAATPRHVLVVDDNPAVRELLGEIVEYEGYIPVFAASGAEACAAMCGKHAQFALILLDVEMPGIDGFGVREFQLKVPTLSEIPTVMITGRHLTEEDRDRLAAVEYLSKPVPLAAVGLAIARHARTSLEPVPVAVH
jgi:CheY-like chemotaxis protein